MPHHINICSILRFQVLKRGQNIFLCLDVVITPNELDLRMKIFMSHNIKYIGKREESVKGLRTFCSSVYCQSYLSSGFTLTVNTLSSTTSYVRDVMFDDKLPVSGYVRSFPTRSVTECAMRCRGESDCFSFFYTASANVCQIHDTVLEFITFTGLVNPTPTTKYFVSPDYVGKFLSVLSLTSEYEDQCT